MSLTVLRKAVVVAFVVLVTGCASNKAASSTPSISSNTLMAEEIAKYGSTDAYATVQSLRPQWLVIRGQSSLGPRVRETIKVYVDGSLYGTVETLRQIPANTVASLRRMDGIEASNRYGLDHGAGAILVSSKK